MFDIKKSQTRLNKIMFGVSLFLLIFVSIIFAVGVVGGGLARNEMITMAVFEIAMFVSCISFLVKVKNKNSEWLWPGASVLLFALAFLLFWLGG